MDYNKLFLTELVPFSREQDAEASFKGRALESFKKIVRVLTDKNSVLYDKLKESLRGQELNFKIFPDKVSVSDSAKYSEVTQIISSAQSDNFWINVGLEGRKELVAYLKEEFSKIVGKYFNSLEYKITLDTLTPVKVSVLYEANLKNDSKYYHTVKFNLRLNGDYDSKTGVLMAKFLEMQAVTWIYILR